MKQAAIQNQAYTRLYQMPINSTKDDVIAAVSFLSSRRYLFVEAVIFAAVGVAIPMENISSVWIHIHLLSIC